MSNPDQTLTPAAAPARPKRRWLIIVVVAVLVVGAGAGGAYWWWRQPVAAAAGGDAASAPAHAETVPGSLLPLETFTVNLADPGTSRFLRVTVQLVLSGKETAAEVQHDPLVVTRIRSAVLELLTTQQSSALVTPEGKSALKQEIATRVTGAVGHDVSDVLFSDFVVQF